jgi:hypothetical protein
MAINYIIIPVPIIINRRKNNFLPTKNGMLNLISGSQAYREELLAEKTATIPHSQLTILPKVILTFCKIYVHIVHCTVLGICTLSGTRPIGWMQPVTGIYLVDSLDKYKTCTNTCLGGWEARPRCRYARYARIRAVGQHTNLPDLYI